MANKRQRIKRALTKKRKGELYYPRSPYHSAISIKSADINPRDRYQMKLLSSAQMALYQLQHYLYDPIELEGVDIDTLKWLSGSQFRKITDDIANWSRFDRSFYDNDGYIYNKIAKTVSKYFKGLKHVKPHNIIKTIMKAYRDMKKDIEEYIKDKKPHNNPFVVVSYSKEKENEFDF